MYEDTIQKKKIQDATAEIIKMIQSGDLDSMFKAYPGMDDLGSSGDLGFGETLIDGPGPLKVDFTDKAKSPKLPPRYPLTDIAVGESKKMYINIALAGWSRDEFDIEVSKGLLLISGTKPEESEPKDKLDVIQEMINKRDFTRKIALSEEYLTSDSIEASFKDGILAIVITPKDAERKIVSIS